MGRRARGLVAAWLVVSPIVAVVVPLGGGAGVGCAAAADPAALQAEMRALRAEIVKEIGNAPCANLVHCRLLALGVRPCGGPDEYLAYSSVTGDKTQLENKALEYALLQEDLHRARGTVGACVMLPLPRLVCLDNRCRTE